MRNRAFQFLALAVCASAQQQPVARIQIYAPDDQLVAGTSVQFSAVALNGMGQPLPTATIVWSSQAFATVDSNGLVTGNTLGVATVAAAVGNVRAQANIQVVPWRMEIDPPSATAYLGENLQFTARALNRKGEPIPGVNLNWTTGRQQLGLVSAGLLIPLAVGDLTLRAEVQYVGASLPFPGLFAAQAVVRIRNRPDYIIQRVASSSQVGHSFQFRGGGPMSANENGQFVLNASLDGLASVALRWQDGQFEMIDDRVAIGSEPRINAAGDILLASSQGLSVLRDGRRVPRFLNGYATFDLLDNIILHSAIPPRMNDKGDIVFAARFRDSANGATRTNRTGVFRTARNTIELLWSVEDQSAPVNLQLGIDGAANVYIHQQSFGPNGQASIHRLPNASQRQKVIATGDFIDGGPVTWLSGFALNESGDLAFAYDSGRGTTLVKRSASGTQTVYGGACCAQQVYQVNSRGSVLFLANGALRLWEEGLPARTLLNVGSAAPNGEPVRSIRTAFLTTAGDVLVHATFAETPEAILRISGSNRAMMLLTYGQRINATARVRLESARLVRGRTGANPFVLLLNSSNLFELSSGGLVPRLLSGDRLPDGTLVQGPMNATQGGDATYIIVGGRLYILTGSGIERQLPGNDLGFGSPMAVNARGTVVAMTFRGGESMLTLVENGAPRTIAEFNRPDGSSDASPTGGFFTNCEVVAIDDSGRVMCQMRVRGGNSGVFLYDGVRWNQAPLVAGITHTDPPLNGVTASGDRFYGRFSLRTGEQYVGVLSGDRWETLIGVDAPMPNGSLVSFRNYSLMDATSNGRLLLNFDAGSQQLFVHAGGGWSYVQSVHDLMPDGEFCTGVRDIAIREDGRLFFASDTSNGDYAIYTASPIPR